MIRGKKPNWVRKLAESRIKYLFELADKNKKKHPERARRYVEITRKISERYNIVLTPKQKKKFCKRCGTYFTAKNLKVRIVPKIKSTAYICLECGFKKLYKTQK